MHPEMHLHRLEENLRIFENAESILKDRKSIPLNYFIEKATKRRMREHI